MICTYLYHYHCPPGAALESIVRWTAMDRPLYIDINKKLTGIVSPLSTHMERLQVLLISEVTSEIFISN
jgi:hypothetical protein